MRNGEKCDPGYVGEKVLGLWKEGKSSSVIGLPTAGASQLNLMQQVSVDAGLFS